MYRSHILEQPTYESSTLQVYEYSIYVDGCNFPVQWGEITVYNDGCTHIAHVYITEETDPDYVLDAMDDADIDATDADFSSPMEAVRAVVATQVAAWEVWAEAQYDKHYT